MSFEPIFDYFSRVATNAPWKIAVELIFIGLVVFWTVNFLEGTRGERLFRGVFVILITGSLILNLIVERFGFERLEFLYKGFVLALLIIAVAAFQPEIRRALIRIGQARILTGSSAQLSRTAEEVITAVKHMSQSKTGAIIVFEQSVGLAEFIETGVKLDAKVTAEILETIFYEGTVLHDLAVIIRGDRIEAASVQLPLAEGGSVESLQLGSRHRAAIGISATSDAKVLVVSEETGIISLAVNGNLMRKLSEDEIRKHLSSSYSESNVILNKFLKKKAKKKH